MPESVRRRCSVRNGKLFADRGYLFAKLFEKLWERKIQLFTKLKKNMKNKLMAYTDKLLLRKRAVIESVYEFGVFFDCTIIDKSIRKSFNPHSP